MDVLIEDNVLYRERKKWIKRLCKLVRTNTFSDSVKLLVCSTDDGKSKRSSRQINVSILSKHVIYGHLHGVHMGSQSNIMYVVCKSTVECLAFDDFDSMKMWSDILGQHLHDISQFVDLIHADKRSQLKAKLEGRLFFNCSHISFIRSPSSCEPKLFMSWKIADIMEYGSRLADKNNSRKSKQKNNVFDDSLNLFIMKVSPLFQCAPNTHIFSCNDPQKFCGWMENLSSNQENMLYLKNSEIMSQRLRIDSYNIFQRSFNKSEYSPYNDQSCESTTSKNCRFFPESDRARTPRFQRSSSEVPHYRNHLSIEDNIPENEELELNEQNVSIMCQSQGTQHIIDSESPTRSSTLTCLERYPYEKERSHRSQMRRQMSEGATKVYMSPRTSPWPIEFTIPRLKSGNNYCSLLDLQQGHESLSNTPAYETKILSSSMNLSRGHTSSFLQYVSLNDSFDENQCQYEPSSQYAKIQFNELIHDISEYCKTDNCSVQLRHADLIILQLQSSNPRIRCKLKSKNLSYCNNTQIISFVWLVILFQCKVEL